MVEVTAVFAYTAEQEDELTFKVGDVITDVVKMDGGWWEGTLNGQRGVFPDNFVKEKKKSNYKRSLSKSSKHSSPSRSSPSRSSPSPTQASHSNKLDLPFKATVLYNYDALNEDELSLVIGDVIEVISEEEEGWWKGRLRGSVGVFPSNFVKVLKDEDHKVKSSSPPEATDHKVGQLQNSHASSNHIAVTAITKETTDNDRNKMAAVSADGDHVTQKAHSHSARSIDSEVKASNNVATTNNSSSSTSASPIVLRDRKPRKDRARAVYSYAAENDDELTLAVGDIVMVLDKNLEDVGWWKGELNGKIGVFPDNFVELVVAMPESPTAAPMSPSRGEPLPASELRKKIERPPPPDPSKVPGVNRHVATPAAAAAAKSDHRKSVGPSVPAKPNSFSTSNGKATATDPKLMALTDEYKVNAIKAEVVLDSIAIDDQKMSHPTADRVKAPSRRPPSNIRNNSPQREPEVKPVEKPQPTRAARPQPPVKLRKDDQPPVPPLKPSISHDGDTAANKSDRRAPATPGNKPISPAGSQPSSAPPLSSVHDTVARLQAEVTDLRQSLDRIRLQGDRRVAQLREELDDEKRARQALQDDLEWLKKTVLARL